jgi:2-polyprenyl-3-methyl-5-hydroxy-6-metoxy-1,4-benzoquinol methylase
MSAGDYATKDADYFAHARTEIIPLLPPNVMRIADIGGASGATLSAVKAQHPAATTILLDLHAQSVETARSRGHLAYQCDLEKAVPDILGTCDTVLFLDVLEHLVDPWSVLRRAVESLPAGATVIVSVPNIRYWQVSFGLFFLGRWRLQDAGVLDRTHLRFFTRETGAVLVTGAGLSLGAVTGRLAGGRRNRLINRITLGLFADFLRSQYIYVGRKA